MSTMGHYANYQLHEGTLLACSSFHFPGSEGACQQLTFGVSPGAAAYPREGALLPRDSTEYLLLGVANCRNLDRIEFILSPSITEERCKGATAEEETQTRPPYVEDPEAKEPFKHKYVGKCYCGAVEFAANSDPVDVRVCHCRGCQRTHGASYQWSAFFHKEQILFTKGHEHLEFYNTETRTPHHKLPVKILCRCCHAPIADEGRRMMLIFPPGFDWEDGKMPESFKPRCHIFYGTRTFDIEDGVPKFEGMKEKSSKLPDCEDVDDEEASHPVIKPRGQKESENGNSSSPPKKGSPKGGSNGHPKDDDSIASHVKRARTST
ncbi:hypothetical protein WJX84_000561 [Apatococcus fuscideae]|uniref:CENP-V/GFA domain-containing protein n=1 Tax=Apatococcus fuscideae TaxID=2026836 RepID=A0AAW1TFZ9_9CHLO